MMIYFGFMVPFIKKNVCYNITYDFDKGLKYRKQSLFTFYKRE